MRGKILTSLPRLYNPTEAAVILGVSLKTLHKWLDSGALPYTRLGPAARLIRIKAQDLEDFLRAGAVPPSTLTSTEQESADGVANENK
ncbi:MAG: helix-turn-helix domain-containing protein [Thermoflexales bacterium]|nr:helix-turn-helix domain-containing protein [Thermoflexales bacterium]